jgi:hypothetical protein
LQELKKQLEERKKDLSIELIRKCVNRRRPSRSRFARRRRRLRKFRKRLLNSTRKLAMPKTSLMGSMAFMYTSNNLVA